MFDTGGVTGKLTQAHALLTEAASMICSDLSGPAAYDALAEALPAVGQLDLVVCLLSDRMRLTGEFTVDNAVSMSSWLRSAAHSSDQWATVRVNAGRALVDHLPMSLAAMHRGEVTLEHAAVIARAVDGREGVLTAKLDAVLAQAAATVSPRDLQRIASRLLEELAPDSQDKDRQRNASHRQKAHLSDTPDGGRLDADLDAEGTAILRAALEKFMPKPEPVMNPDGSPGNPLLLSQRRAIALVEMARQALDFGTGHAGAANKTHLVLTMSAQHLRDSYGAATTADGSILPISVIRRLACDSKVIPLVLGSDSLPIDIGRTTRVIPPHMRTALNHRDKGCATPGCDRPPSWCDGHHVVSWLDGGITALINLVLLCRRHHTLLHQGKLHIKAHGNQTFTFTNINTSSHTATGLRT